MLLRVVIWTSGNHFLATWSQFLASWSSFAVGDLISWNWNNLRSSELIFRPWYAILTSDGRVSVSASSFWGLRVNFGPYRNPSWTIGLFKTIDPHTPVSISLRPTSKIKFFRVKTRQNHVILIKK